ncbi:hypothetical protein DPMN_163522 [Dreissena polymorpha]|uniref:Uncharacterized protein n=1 Tax=Dreissena polymorpha TaxID=45954 RepID=A0A9D4EWX9_DREPO|nr:hypothetical protein DPMN_163522 [Dreissena polymorpha]
MSSYGLQYFIDQNKNRFLIGYFTWRVMTGRHDVIEYHMLIPGHARCLVDNGFGHLKKLYRYLKAAFVVCGRI